MPVWNFRPTRAGNDHDRDGVRTTRVWWRLLSAVEHGLSNTRSEATNTHLRLLTRRAYGYRSPKALIAIADLTRGGLCPPLPGRS
ncbi:MAG: transposase [Pseudonocardiales bacterium]